MFNCYISNEIISLKENPKTYEPSLRFFYLLHTHKNLVPNNFDVLCSQKAYNAFYYAYYILHLRDRFKLGESIIATDSRYSHDYALYVLKDRFELGEPKIAESAFYSYSYSRNVCNGRFELGEKIISTDQMIQEQYSTMLSLKDKGIMPCEHLLNPIYSSY